MAGEVGHVVYGARLLAHLGNDVAKDDYWVGTLFPDIKHLGIISRHRTHPEGVTLQTLKGKNDFHTGMRVHAWVDSTREKFLHEKNTKEYLPWHPFVPHALKLLEDEYLYEKYDGWSLIDRTLGNVHEDEIYYVSSKERIQEWHTILKHYLSTKPTDETRIALAIAIGLSESSAIEINNVVNKLRENKRAIELTDEFLQHIELLLK